MKQQDRESAKMNVISLGWGVQSFTLAAMSALGELEPAIAIHSDTRREREETYAFAAKWTPWLETRGVQVITVTANDNTKDSVKAAFERAVNELDLESQKPVFDSLKSAVEWIKTQTAPTTTNNAGEAGTEQ